ncbi:unnamed protein product [Leuciscus chuanchicus]
MISRLLEQRRPVMATLSDPDVTPQGKRFLDLKSDQWSLLEEVEQVLRPFECATVFLSGESYVTVSALPLLVKGLQKSIKSTLFENAAVKAFQGVAAQEMTSRWEWETKFRDDGENNPSGSVLYELQLSYGLFGKASEESITIIHPAGDESMHKFL